LDTVVLRAFFLLDRVRFNVAVDTLPEACLCDLFGHIDTVQLVLASSMHLDHHLRVLDLLMTTSVPRHREDVVQILEFILSEEVVQGPPNEHHDHQHEGESDGNGFSEFDDP